VLWGIGKVFGIKYEFAKLVTMEEKCLCVTYVHAIHTLFMIRNIEQ